jgi:dTDP-4-dehydrorhamnose 3,5-epimerase
VSAPYCREAEGGVRWNDPEVGITWPRIAGGYVITPRDRSWPALSELETPFLHEMEKAGRTA